MRGAMALILVGIIFCAGSAAIALLLFLLGIIG